MEGLERMKKMAENIMPRKSSGGYNDFLLNLWSWPGVSWRTIHFCSSVGEYTVSALKFARLYRTKICSNFCRHIYGDKLENKMLREYTFEPFGLAEIIEWRGLD